SSRPTLIVAGEMNRIELICGVAVLYHPRRGRYPGSPELSDDERPPGQGDSSGSWRGQGSGRNREIYRSIADAAAAGWINGDKTIVAHCVPSTFAGRRHVEAAHSPGGREDLTGRRNRVGAIAFEGAGEQIGTARLADRHRAGHYARRHGRCNLCVADHVEGRR